MSCYREYCPRCKRVQLVCEGVCQCGALLDLVVLDDGFLLTSNQKESSNAIPENIMQQILDT